MFKALVMLARALCLVSVLWAFVLYMNNWRSALSIYQNASGYRPAEFVVADLSYQPAWGSGKTRYPDTWYARGRVAGQDERFNLAGYLAHDPRSIDDLRSQIAIGSVFAVLYNPDVLDSGIAGQTIRVLPYRPGFLEHSRSRFEFWSALTFLPLAVGVLLLLCAEFARRLVAKPR